MAMICGDNRFEIIGKAKEALIDCTNIEASPEEMAVLDNFLFRCWQMGWLDKYDEALEQTRWIPVTERLPDNAQHKGAFCPKYQVMTKYGVTEGWYNPDYENWYVLLWFMTKRFHETDIDLKRGDIPEVVKIPLKAGIVTAWMPLPESVIED